MKTVFLIFILLVLAFDSKANLPPTSTQGSNDANPVTTFKFLFPNVTFSHTGTSASFGTVGVASGGTGATTLTSNNVILGNGTSAVQFVAPGTSGNALVSNGTTWQSTTLSGNFFVLSQVIVDSGTGHGSTNTKIRRWINTRQSVGSDITYADSSTLGGSFTVNSDGVYAVSAMDRYDSADEFIGITINDSVPTTNLSSGPMTYAQGVRAMAFSISTRVIGVSWTGKLTSGDVIRVHDNGSLNATDSYSMVTVTRVQ